MTLRNAPNYDMSWGQQPLTQAPDSRFMNPAFAGVSTAPVTAESFNFGSPTVNQTLNESLGGSNDIMASIRDANTAAQPGFFKNLWGTLTDKEFWLGDFDKKTGAQTLGAAMPLLTLGNGLMQGYLGMKQYGLAKDQLAQQQKAFGLNYDAQRQTLNAEMRDRQIRRYHERPDLYQSPDAYMRENGVRER